MRSLAFRSLRLDRDLVANILDVAVQEVGYLLNGRAERETISEFGQINRRPRRFASSVHGPPQRESRLEAFCAIFAAHYGIADTRSGAPASQSSPAAFLRAPEHGRTIGSFASRLEIRIVRNRLNWSCRCLAFEFRSTITTSHF
jgi:hypothetical protein